MRRGRRGDPVMGRHRQGRAVGHEADEIP